MDRQWIEQNRHAVCQSMIGLFHRLTGNPIYDVVQIGSTIEEWTFTITQTTREEMGDHEASLKSMVNDGPTDSFVEIRKRTERNWRKTAKKEKEVIERKTNELKESGWGG